MAQVEIVRLADVPKEEARAGRARNLALQRLPSETGIQGVVVSFSRVTVPDGYFTPRHRHNFDQIRFAIKGTFANKSGDLEEGTCAYFPEGVYYGPQNQEGECVSLTLQFQGPSGERFLNNDEMREGYRRLVEKGGRFEGGVYTEIKPNGRKINRDSYQAAWEEFCGRKMTYPPARYGHPVMMKTGTYRWLPDRERPGVEDKHLGSFTEYRHTVALRRLAPGAAIAARRQRDAELLYLLEGSVSYGGKTYDGETYFYLPVGAEIGAFSSATGATFYSITLPMIAELMAARPAAQAAE